MARHYLNQCWDIVSWTLRNKLQWNLNHNLYIFIQENAFQNVIWKMVANVLISWWHKTVVEHTAYTVYPKKYAHSFVVLCFVVVMQSFIMNSHEVFIHIHQGCFAGTGAIVRLPQCQRSKPDGYGKISQCITTTKHSKAKTACIFLGIYCITVLLPYACTMTKGPFILQIWWWCHHEIKILW